MKYIGAHVSISGGIENAPENAQNIGAKAFAIFTKNQRQWLSKPLSRDNIDLFKKNCKALNFKPEHILPHDGYLINLGNPDKDALKKSRQAFLDEMQRCEQLGLPMLNFHPGAHLNQASEEECMKTIADSINMALDQTNSVTALIENTSGQGSHVGYKFEHLKFIIDHVEDKSRIGVCFDTCHGYTAGYDIKTSDGYKKTFSEFDRIIGLKYLKGMHLNDSKKGLGSRVDRHENIGRGTLGEEVFSRIMNDPKFDDIPIILETPDESLWGQEIQQLYKMIRNA
jgi:deoxyribonuclease-4